MHSVTKTWTRRAVLAQASAMAMAALGTPVRAQERARLAISYPTRSGASWPLWIARHGGYFQKYGFDTTLDFGVHPAGVAALVSGQVQMINYGIEQIMAAVVRDPSLVMMGSNVSLGSFAMVGQASVADMKDLRGKRIGVGRLGDTLYVYTLDLLRKYGMGPRDVQWISTGTDATARAHMLVAGQLDATLMVAPIYFKLQAQGMRVLDLLANHGDILVSTAYVFKKSWAKGAGDAPARLVMAQAEAIKRFYEDKAFAVQAYRAFDPQEPPLIEKLYDLYASRNVLDRVPLLSKAAIESARTRLAAEIPLVKDFDFGQAVDMGVVRQLVAEGFFRKLFGPQVREEEARKLAASY